MVKWKKQCDCVILVVKNYMTCQELKKRSMWNFDVNRKVVPFHLSLIECFGEFNYVGKITMCENDTFVSQWESWEEFLG